VNVAVRHLQEVAEDLVVANLERADTGSRAFISLNFGNSILAAITQGSPLVESGVDPIPDAWLIADRNRWPVDEEASDCLTQVVAAIPESDMPAECSFRFGLRCRTRALERRVDQRQSRHRIAERPQLARRGTTCGRLSSQPLDIPHSVQCFSHRFANKRISQCAYRAQACFDRGPLDERSEKPLAEQTGSHWRKCAIENS